MLYEQYFIDDLRDRADLVRIIEPYAQLKKKGSNWMGCCPFHQEKTPSFSVSPAKGFYKCFGCGKGGNAYTFLMEMEGLNFPEAIQRVAEISGVQLPEPVDDKQFVKSKKRSEEKKKLSDQVVELNAIALEFWEAELQSDHPKAKAARDYMESRGISKEIQKTFRVGYSPDSWDALLNLLRDKIGDDNLIEQSGLVSVNEEKDRVFDRFRGRIMFPVLDINGRPVAFGARAMGDDQPKYLNSPETPAYVKGQHLYGLYQSKDEIRKKKFVILVEGYLDLIALYQFGITNVAASLGTAFTPEQSKMLSRFSKKVVINYDGDSAGINAARKAIEILLEKDFEIKVLVLPDGKDPDDFIRTEGTERYEVLRGKATPCLNFVLNSAAKSRNLRIEKHKYESMEEVLPVICAISGGLEKREFFDSALNQFNITDKYTREELWKKVKAGTPARDIDIGKILKRTYGNRITVAEDQLLDLIVFDHELRATVLPILEKPDYEALTTAPVFEALIALDAKGMDVTLETLLEELEDEETIGDFVRLLMVGERKRVEGEVIDGVLHDAESCIFALRSMAISNRILEVSQELIAAELNRDSDAVIQLSQEQMDLAKMKQSLLNKIAET
ncbi:MAG: DNA primase [Acidobacteriota bacterium]